LGAFPSDITTSHYQELHDQLDRLEHSITSFEMADRQGQAERGEPDDINDMAQGVPTVHPNPLPGKLGELVGAEHRGGTGDVSTVNVPVSPGSEVPVAQPALVNAGVNPAATPPFVHSVSQVFSPQYYQRLPHPLTQLLKELPLVDGTDVNRLCDFLLKILHIRQVGQMSDQTVFEIMYPYCRGELLAFVTNALTVRESFEHFHARLLGQFIPARQIPQLRAERYERAQFEGQSLATYVQSIRDAARMLRIVEDEAQVVGRIVEGFTSAQRARFDFQAPPSSLLQLEQLAVVDRNIAYADRTRTIPSTAVTVGAVESQAQLRDSRPTSSQSSRVFKQGKPIVCFYCRKPGHTQKRCFLRLDRCRKSDRRDATNKP
jgi:hypothetical protein